MPLGLWIGGAQPVAVGLVGAGWDKLVHLGVYAVLAVSIGMASRLRGGGALLAGFAGAVLVGAVDEWNQMQLPGRAAEWGDLLADASGAALGCAALVVLARLRNRRAVHRAQ